MELLPLLELAQSSSQGSGSSEVTVGQVIAGAGIGAALGAVLSALYTQWRTDVREKKAAKRITTGIARVMHEDFRRQQATLARATFRRGWWRSQEMLAPQITDDDVKQIATALDDPTSWAAVARASGWMSYLRELRGKAEQPPPPTEGQLALFRDIYQYLDIARYSLHRTADVAYRRHNSDAMRRDAIEDAQGNPAATRHASEVELRSLSLDDAKATIKELEKKWAPGSA